MNLPIASLTLTNAKKHEDALANLKAQIEELEAKTPRDMWQSELQKLVL
jgi:hypothetical protein